jgi:nucleotide-binding universal stress UspA family protein
MPVIKKILFPVNFSERSRGAARYVEAFVGWFEAELMLLHVVGDGTNTLAKELKPASQAQLDEFLADELKHFTTHRVCEVGDPAAKIVEIAHSWKPDLVMIPADYGFGSYFSLFLGSITAKVLDSVEVPVWTDVHTEQAPSLEKITCSKVLCAVDFGGRSRAVLEWGAFLAREHDAELRIVHALAAGGDLDGQPAASPAAAAKAGIAELQLGAGTKATTFIAEGEVASVVSREAQDFSADLLIIGRQNALGATRHSRHNSYDIINKSPCPVISI